MARDGQEDEELGHNQHSPPTGTISIIAGCSSSIEPFYALAFIRHVLDGKELMEVNWVLERKLRERGGLYSEQLVNRIASTGTLVGGTSVPEDLKRVFRTALEIRPEWHVTMQATFQKYVDAAVSKTINLPSDATVEDVEEAYRLARQLNCKGITVYRDRSKSEQVLYAGREQKPKAEFIVEVPEKYVEVDATFDPRLPPPASAMYSSTVHHLERDPENYPRRNLNSILE